MCVLYLFMYMIHRGMKIYPEKGERNAFLKYVNLYRIISLSALTFLPLAPPTYHSHAPTSLFLLLFIIIIITIIIIYTYICIYMHNV